MADSHLSGQRRGTTRVFPLPSMTPAEVLRLHRLARELRLTDQILSDDVDSLSIVEYGPAPAWNTLEGDHISFALNQMPFPETRLDVAVWLGTNAHELGHSLFSPRRESLLIRRIIEANKFHLLGIVDLHNIVEDQRQERLLLGRFAPWRAYLTAALGHHIHHENELSWVLLAGRTWLPDKVRVRARAAFTAKFGRGSADQVSDIVGAYQRLVDPGESESGEAFDLLVRLHDLLPEIPKPPHPCEPTGDGEPDTSDPFEDAPPPADEADDGDESGEGKEEAADEGEGEGKGQDGDEEADEGEDGDGKGGQSAGNQPGRRGSGRDLRRDLKKAADEQLHNDAETRKDVDSILDTLDHGRAGSGANGADALGRYEPVTDAARRLHREISEALVDLKDDCEPGWDRRVDSGRINIRRLINPRVDYDALFDRYDPGHMDATQLELVLLLDVSGSMTYRMWSVGEATWAIHHAADDIEATTTVLSFDSGPHRVLAKPGERPDERMFIPDDLGGTDPASALTEALRLTSDSSARNRLVMILTDGSWYHPDKSEELIDMLNQAGVVTALAQLGDWSKDAHHCQHYAIIDDLTELARLFQRVALKHMEAWT